MKIKQIVETPDGEVTFQGNLSGPELAFVVELGVNYLLQQGALPFASTQNISIADVHKTNDGSVQ